jgi:hypothetical protein
MLLAHAADEGIDFMPKQGSTTRLKRLSPSFGWLMLADAIRQIGVSDLLSLASRIRRTEDRTGKAAEGA